MSNEKAQLEVICAGLPRTSTTSLKIALQHLGFGPCHHMYDCMFGDDAVRQADEFCKVFRGEKLDLSIVDGFRSICDSPGCDAYEQLMEAFPNAKIVLQTRDPASWARSCIDSVFTWNTEPPYAPCWFGALPNIAAQRRLGKCISDTWKTRPHDPTCKELDGTFITRWNEEVIRRVPAERLLVWNVKEGYPPLCRFLGVPVPDEPFPHVNDAAYMACSLKCCALLCHAITAMLGGGVALLGTAAYRAATTQPGARLDVAWPWAAAGAGLLTVVTLIRRYSSAFSRTVLGYMVPLMMKSPRRSVVLTSVAAVGLSSAAGYCYNAGLLLK